MPCYASTMQYIGADSQPMRPENILIDHLSSLWILFRVTFLSLYFQENVSLYYLFYKASQKVSNCQDGTVTVILPWATMCSTLPLTNSYFCLIVISVNLKSLLYPSTRTRATKYGWKPIDRFQPYLVALGATEYGWKRSIGFQPYSVAPWNMAYIALQ